MALNLEVNILGEFKNLTKATKGATNQLKKFQNSTRSISRNINGLLATIGVGVSLNALKNFVKSAVSGASELEQQVGATQIIFGEYAESVIKSSQDAAQAFGISSKDYLRASNLINSQLKGYGFSAEDAADSTQILVERGADMAATFGGTTLDAINAISAVFRGEYNQIEKYASQLRKSDITARVAAKGFAGLTGEALKQQEAIASVELVLETTAQTQGQNAREADTLKGAMERVTASFDNARDTIGGGFAPAIAAAAGFINQNIGVFENLSVAVGERLREAFEGTGTSAETFGGKVIIALTDLTDFLNGTAQTDNSFSKLSTTMAPIIDLFGAFIEFVKGAAAVLDGLAVGLFGWVEAVSGGKVAITSFADLIRLAGEFLQEFGRNIGVVVSFFVPFTAGFKFVGKLLAGLANPFKAVGTALKGLKDDALRFTEEFQRGGVGVQRLANESNLAFGVIRSYVGMTRDEVIRYGKTLDAQDNRRIRNYVDVITTQFTGGDLIPASNTNDSKRPDDIKPGYTEHFINWRDGNQWYTRTWTGYGWKITKDADAYKMPTSSSGGSAGSGMTLFQKKVGQLVESLQSTLDEAKNRITDTAANFRDAVSLSFGVITNGAFASFDANRVIRQMQRIKDSAKTFAKDIKALQSQGADKNFIDDLLGMDPMEAAATARGLLSSGRLDEFLKLRSELSSVGAGAGGAANFGINGTGTVGLQKAIEGLTRTMESGSGSTYNINVNNANKMTANDIVAAIKKYEKTSGRKVFS